MNLFLDPYQKDDAFLDELCQKYARSMLATILQLGVRNPKTRSGF